MAPMIVPQASDASARLARGSRFFAQESALLAHRDQCAHVVEQIDKEKDEDQLSQSQSGRRAKIEFEKRARWLRPGKQTGRPVADA